MPDLGASICSKPLRWPASQLLGSHTSTQTLVKSFEVTEQPVRSAKFVARKQWIITGADDMLIRVYNYNTMDKVKVFEAHTDYIRSDAAHRGRWS